MVHRTHILLAIVASLAVAALLAACGPQSDRELVVLVHDSFDISADAVAAFETEHGATVTFLKSGDAGEMLNKAILSASNPLGDVLFGVDNTFLSRALEHDLFEAYTSPALSAVPPSLILDPDHYLLPIDWGDVCLNYDRAWFEDRDLDPPGTLDDLIAPPYRGLTVVLNPATSSPGLAFLLATIAQYGEDGYRDYWRALRENDVLVENGWTAAYYGQFTAASEGDRPIVVSYATSPAAEVYYSEGKYQIPPTGAVTAPGACFRQVEFAGILEGTEQPDLARAFVDWMLGLTFQEDIPLHMWVYPANEDAALPPVFVDHARQAFDPATLPPDAIAAGRERWIEGWTEEVLR
jgi:thiamine transport system substrate-binding protein